MKKHAAVIDTNILINMMRSEKGAAFELVRLFFLHDAFVWIISPGLVLEYEEVLHRELPGINEARAETGLPKVTKKRVTQFLDDLCARAYPVGSVDQLPPMDKDADDRPTAALAVQEGAALVTNNKKDFKEAAARYKIAVVDAAQFLKVVRQ